MKKVLIVITTGFANYGGLTSVMMNYYRYIDKKRFHIDFASTNNPDEHDKAYNYLMQSGSKYYCLGSRKKKAIEYLKNLSHLVKKEKYDVVHVNGNSATMFFDLLVCRIAGVKKIIAHGHTTQTEHPVMHWMLSGLLRYVYTDAVAVSREAGEWLFKKDYIVLKNAIDVEQYVYDVNKRRIIRDQLKLKNEKVIGHIGKLYYPKNHSFILDIFGEYNKLNSSSKLLLVGSGGLETKLKEKVKSLGIEDNVIFLGMRDDIPLVIQAFDYFLFPSIYEGLGLAIIEAQASGLYCLASKNVPIETKVTNNIEYMDLKEKAYKWAKKIEKTINGTREEQMQCALIDIRRNGYDVKCEFHKLEKIYDCK